MFQRIFYAHYVKNRLTPEEGQRACHPPEQIAFSYGHTEAVGLESADLRNETLLRGQTTVRYVRLLLWGALKAWHCGGGRCKKQNKDPDGDSL
jgi:hypothetical protein